MDSYTDHVVVISGGSSGIGLGFARALASRGAKVAIIGRNVEKLDSARGLIESEGHRVLTLNFDVTDEAAWVKGARQVAEQLGPIQFLILNAGLSANGDLIVETPPPTWNVCWDVNVMGVVHGLSACVPGMLAHGLPGRVLFTSSMTAIWRRPRWAAYSISKAAVSALAEALRVELQGTNLSASVMCPGNVRTDIVNSSLRTAPGSRDEQTIAQQRTLGKSGLDPLDVANAALPRLEAGDFYLFTHYSDGLDLQERVDEMRQAMRLGAKS